MPYAVFYYDKDGLTARATLSFYTANPGGLAYNWETYEVVVGAAENGAVMTEKLGSSDDYATTTDITSGIDSSETQIVKLEYI